MKKIAFVFPGQGSQSVGMGQGFYDLDPAYRACFDEANSLLGFDLKAIMFSGPAELLSKTENTQPALLTSSYAALLALRANGFPKPSLVAGHSLGEYTALVAAGVLSFTDAVRLVHLRGKYMQEAAGEGVGKMCALIGLDGESVAKICTEASTEDSIVVPANINGLAQVVISGHAGAVEKAAELALANGAKKAIALDVSVPSHSPLMIAAAEKLASDISNIEFKEFSAPIVTNVEAAVLSDTARVGELLTRQLTSPVRWVESVLTMKNFGIEAIVEVGNGKVLTSLIKRIDRDIKLYNIGSPEDIEGVAEALG